MIIKKIKLENIRSYISSEIDFPEGSVLLSGNIGSGKSSILLAIEFALFGLIKGEISGEGLLRKGKKKGIVELCFDIGGKEIIIKRSLKRTSTSVAQDSGNITINGNKKNATAVELKQEILNLLEYPSELLTKKSLVYRYTVYTPQEEMKNILAGDRGYRLDTLRRVFNIDKYKRIRENAKIILGKLKEKKNEYGIKTGNLENKKEELVLRETRVSDNKKLYEIIVQEVNIIKEVIGNKKKEINVFEEDLNKIRNYKKELDIGYINLKNKIEKLTDNTNRIKNIGEIKTGLEIKDFKPIINKKENSLRVIELDFRENYKKMNELAVNKGHSEKIIKSISELEECPVCMQKVSHDHKSKIFEKENEKISGLDSQLEILGKKEKESEKNIEFLKKEIEELRKNENKNELIKIKLKELELKNKLEEENILIKKEIENLKFKNNELIILINEKKFDEEKINEFKKELDILIIKERELDIKKATIQNEIKNNEEIIFNLKKDIENKLLLKDKLKSVSILIDNLSEKFVGLMELIEKNVMLKLHYDFESLFKKWFEMLVDSELIKIRLDNEFSPLIQQNGHDIDYNYLSGGEKTAAALAYRLALNQVINNLVEGVNTKDLIILDEPTDGFSSEQLERMRMILGELNMKQIIIVSHEDKIETFVDNIIRFEKKEHVSYII